MNVGRVEHVLVARIVLPVGLVPVSMNDPAPVVEAHHPPPVVVCPLVLKRDGEPQLWAVPDLNAETATDTDFGDVGSGWLPHDLMVTPSPFRDGGPP